MAVLPTWLEGSLGCREAAGCVAVKVGWIRWLFASFHTDHLRKVLCLQGCDRTSSNPWKLAACWCILAGEFRLTGFILVFVLQLHLTRSLRHGIYRLRHAMTTKIQVFLCLKRDQSAADQMLLETVSTNMALSAVSGWTTGLLTTVVLALQHHSGPKQASTSPRNRRLNCTKKTDQLTVSSGSAGKVDPITSNCYDAIWLWVKILGTPMKFIDGYWSQYKRFTTVLLQWCRWSQICGASPALPLELATCCGLCAPTARRSRWKSCTQLQIAMARWENDAHFNLLELLFPLNLQTNPYTYTYTYT